MKVSPPRDLIKALSKYIRESKLENGYHEFSIFIAQSEGGNKLAYIDGKIEKRTEKEVFDRERHPNVSRNL